MFVNSFFQGFRVKAEDAERLKSLQAELSEKGLSAEELGAELKKERRRAEKELARWEMLMMTFLPFYVHLHIRPIFCLQVQQGGVLQLPPARPSP